MTIENVCVCVQQELRASCKEAAPTGEEFLQRYEAIQISIERNPVINGTSVCFPQLSDCCSDILRRASEVKVLTTIRVLFDGHVFIPEVQTTVKHVCHHVFDDTPKLEMPRRVPVVAVFNLGARRESTGRPVR
jgi:hypothetical protein